MWGDNSTLQLTTAPTGNDIELIATGGARQGLVIREDGTLFLWGTPDFVGPIPARLSRDRFEAAHLALTYLYAVRTNNSVETVGKFANGLPADPPAGLRVKGITGGAGFGVAITRNGDLETWGSGAGSMTPPAGKFTQVAARSGYAIALRKDGTLFGWGAVSSPDQWKGWVSDNAGHYYVPGDTFVAIDAGNVHSMALRRNGTVAAWGKNAFLENDAPANVRFTAIAAGFGYSLGLDDDGRIHHWGDASEARGAVPTGRFTSIAAAAHHGAAIRAASRDH